MERLGRPLKSIELTLARVEWCSLGDGSTQVAKEITDIQLTQIADGTDTAGLRGLHTLYAPPRNIISRYFCAPSATCSSAHCKTSVLVRHCVLKTDSTCPPAPSRRPPMSGPVAEGVEMPIHMVLPRLYTCPSVSTRTWGVNFELTVAVHVDDGQSEATAAVKLPLTLLRTPRTGNIHI